MKNQYKALSIFGFFLIIALYFTWNAYTGILHQEDILRSGIKDVAVTMSDNFERDLNLWKDEY